MVNPNSDKPKLTLKTPGTRVIDNTMMSSTAPGSPVPRIPAPAPAADGIPCTYTIGTNRLKRVKRRHSTLVRNKTKLKRRRNRLQIRNNRMKDQAKAINLADVTYDDRAAKNHNISKNMRRLLVGGSVPGTRKKLDVKQSFSKEEWKELLRMARVLGISKPSRKYKEQMVRRAKVPYEDASHLVNKLWRDVC